MSQTLTEDPLRRYRILITGTGGVESHSLFVQYSKHTFSRDYDVSIEDVLYTTVKIENEPISIELTQCIGTEEYRALLEHNIRNAEGIILTYSIISLNSLHALDTFDRIIKKHHGRDNPIPVVLLGNKCDLSDSERQVSFSDGAHFAKTRGWHFFEVSAKKNINVDEAFMKLFTQVRNKDILTHRSTAAADILNSSSTSSSNSSSQRHSRIKALWHKAIKLRH
ncbi:ras family-domain-containing protein [Abortiporus biennis]|nr:ras family-domain-containing protein [Abortiporus biennis]